MKIYVIIDAISKIHSKRINMATKVKNLITGNTIIKPDPIDEEVPYDGGVMITETDTAGIITYANRKFRDMTGYEKEELRGAPHSINRHPDMPKAGFEDMWKTIKSGDYWEGYVKNMAKSGKYYRVIVWVKPKLDETGKIVGYIAGRKIPDKEGFDRAFELYATLKAQENPSEDYMTQEKS